MPAFTYQIPTDFHPTVLGGTQYVSNVTTIEDLVHAVAELQSRITAFNANNPTNQI
jgi:hypothetical protein